MDNSNNRLFVGNLSYQTMERDIQDHFAAAGVVLNVNLMLDKFTGRSRGFAFVEFATPEEAQKAVDMFHGKDLGGRALTVNIARPREERPPGGGDGFVCGMLYGILKGWNAEKSAQFGWASGALAATLLSDYGQPADEEQVWSIWKGNARVRR